MENIPIIADDPDDNTSATVTIGDELNSKEVTSIDKITRKLENKINPEPKRPNWSIFNDNLKFYIENKRYADAIEMLDELDIKINEDPNYLNTDMNININSYNNNSSSNIKVENVINDITERLKSLESTPNLKSMGDLFSDKSLTATEKLFLQNEYKLDLTKNKMLYLFLTNPNLYSDLESGKINNITTSITQKDQ